MAPKLVPNRSSSLCLASRKRSRKRTPPRLGSKPYKPHSSAPVAVSTMGGNGSKGYDFLPPALSSSTCPLSLSFTYLTCSPRFPTPSKKHLAGPDGDSLTIPDSDSAAKRQWKSLRNSVRLQKAKFSTVVSDVVAKAKLREAANALKPANLKDTVGTVGKVIRSKSVEMGRGLVEVARDPKAAAESVASAVGSAASAVGGLGGTVLKSDIGQQVQKMMMGDDSIPERRLLFDDAIQGRDLSAKETFRSKAIASSTLPILQTIHMPALSNTIRARSHKAMLWSQIIEWKQCVRPLAHPVTQTKCVRPLAHSLARAALPSPFAHSLASLTLFVHFLIPIPRWQRRPLFVPFFHLFLTPFFARSASQ